jgi:hypothetical protein
MRQVSLTALPSEDRFKQWVKDNLKLFENASQIDVLSGVKPSGAALVTLNNAVANDIPIWTDATDVTFLTLSTFFVTTLAGLNSGAAWLSALGGAPSGSYLLASNNLSDVVSASTSRNNLGLGSAALLSSAAVAQTANNLSDLANAGTARSNLGLGTAATHPATDFMQGANNLSDVANAATSRTNLGVAYGLKSILFTPNMMFNTTSSGATGPNKTASANGPHAYGWDFAAGGQSFVQFEWTPPKSWDQGTVQVHFVWWQGAVGAGNITWGVQAYSFVNNTPYNQVWGTAIETTSAGGTSSNIFITGPSAAMTTAGTVGQNVPLIIQVYRKGTGTDTLTASARLLGVLLIYNTNANNDT